MTPVRQLWCRPVQTVLRLSIPALARHADKEANPLYPVPLLLDADELARLFERLLDKA